MDLILSNFMDQSMEKLDSKELSLLDSLLAENELEIREWVIEKKNIPSIYKNLVKQILQSNKVPYID